MRQCLLPRAQLLPKDHKGVYFYQIMELDIERCSLQTYQVEKRVSTNVPIDNDNNSMNLAKLKNRKPPTYM